MKEGVQCVIFKKFRSFDYVYLGNNSFDQFVLCLIVRLYIYYVCMILNILKCVVFIIVVQILRKLVLNFNSIDNVRILLYDEYQ